MVTLVKSIFDGIFMYFVTNPLSMSDNYSVKVCVPTLNEEESIGDVIDNIRDVGYEPLVIDGGSHDKTREIAKDKMCDVKIQSRDGGKGAAMKDAFDIIEEDIIVFIDGDRTYEPNHIDRLIKPITDSDYKHVIGSRFSSMEENAMSRTHIFGNRMINLTFRILYGSYLIDILSGFRAIKKSDINDLNIKSDGFDIETELTSLCIKNNIKTTTVPTNYYNRGGYSKLSGFQDGWKIFSRMFECYFRK